MREREARSWKYWCEYHHSRAFQRTMCEYAIRHGFDKLEGYAKYANHCTIRELSPKDVDIAAQD